MTGPRRLPSPPSGPRASDGAPLPAALEAELVELLALALVADLRARPGSVRTKRDATATVAPPRGSDRNAGEAPAPPVPARRRKPVRSRG